MWFTVSPFFNNWILLTFQCCLQAFRLPVASYADFDQNLAVAHSFSLELSNDRLFANAIDAANTVQHPLVTGEPSFWKLSTNEWNCSQKPHDYSFQWAIANRHLLSISYSFWWIERTADCIAVQRCAILWAFLLFLISVRAWSDHNIRIPFRVNFEFETLRHPPFGGFLQYTSDPFAKQSHLSFPKFTTQRDHLRAETQVHMCCMIPVWCKHQKWQHFETYLKKRQDLESLESMKA